MIYADTGFLVSLYLQESTSAEAIAVYSSLTTPVKLTNINRLEFENAIHRAVFQTRITAAESAILLSDFDLDIRNGVYGESGLDTDAMFIEASTLSARHTPVMGTRTLDLMHVAAADMLMCQVILSFDKRQRQSATALGMQVLPTP